METKVHVPFKEIITFLFCFVWKTPFHFHGLESKSLIVIQSEKSISSFIQSNIYRAQTTTWYSEEIQWGESMFLKSHKHLIIRNEVVYQNESVVLFALFPLNIPKEDRTTIIFSELNRSFAAWSNYGLEYSSWMSQPERRILLSMGWNCKDQVA